MKPKTMSYAFLVVPPQVSSSDPIIIPVVAVSPIHRMTVDGVTHWANVLPTMAYHEHLTDSTLSENVLRSATSPYEYKQKPVV